MWRVAPWSSVDSIALVAVTVAAGILRLSRLGDPSDLVFDETYYAKDACLYATSSEALCGIDGEITAVHPPLGKWLLAAGIEALGYDSFGWRIGAAVAGTITVALLYLLARRLLRSTLGAVMASGLLAIDFLHLVQSRIAMLDVFVTLFGTAAVLFIVCDRDRAPAPRRFFARPWRLSAGVAAGAAVASKWPGVVFVLLVIALSLPVGRDAELRGGGRRSLSEGASLFLCLVLVPLAVYLLAYAGRVEGTLLAVPWSEGSWWRAAWDRQVYMLNTLLEIDATHPYQSPAWSWILVRRPVSYFYETAPGGRVEEIMAMGNPVVWWASIPALAYVAVRGVKRRAETEGVILAGFVFTYAPWLIQQSDRSATFIFYLLPVVPFMCLALGYVASSIEETWEGRAACAAFAVLAIGSFVYFRPLLVKEPLTQEEWSSRIRFKDCAVESPAAETSTIVETKARATITRTKLGTGAQNPPTEGWCWI